MAERGEWQSDFVQYNPGDIVVFHGQFICDLCQYVPELYIHDVLYRHKIPEHPRAPFAVGLDSEHHPGAVGGRRTCSRQ